MDDRGRPQQRRDEKREEERKRKPGDGPEKMPGRDAPDRRHNPRSSGDGMKRPPKPQK